MKYSSQFLMVIPGVKTLTTQETIVAGSSGFILAVILSFILNTVYTEKMVLYVLMDFVRVVLL